MAAQTYADIKRALGRTPVDDDTLARLRAFGERLAEGGEDADDDEQPGA